MFWNVQCHWVVRNWFVFVLGWKMVFLDVMLMWMFVDCWWKNFDWQNDVNCLLKVKTFFSWQSEIVKWWSSVMFAMIVWILGDLNVKIKWSAKVNDCVSFDVFGPFLWFAVLFGRKNVFEDILFFSGEKSWLIDSWEM